MLKEFKCEDEISDEDFMVMVQSFEDKIGRLQQNIKHRETALQKVEDEKANEQSQTPKKFDFRYYGAAETNGKLIDKVRRDILKLKT